MPTPPLDWLVATVGTALRKVVPELLAEAAKLVPGPTVVVLLGHKLTQTAVESLWAKDEDDLAEIRRSLRLLIDAPLRTGLEQLRVAMAVVPRTPEEVQHQADRLREARASLDEASQNVPQEQRGVLDLYRGLASLIIPGGAQEARLHLEAFANACEARATALLEAAAAHDRKAASLVRKARGSKEGPWNWGSAGEVNIDQAYRILTIDEAEDEMFTSWQIQQSAWAARGTASQVRDVLRALGKAS